MNEKLEKLLDLLIAGIEKGTDLAQTELPKLAEEILKYEAWSHSMLMWVCVGITIVAVFILIIFLLAEDFDAVIFAFVFSCIATACAVSQYSEIKKIEMAPKYYLLEKIRNTK